MSEDVTGAQAPDDIVIRVRGLVTRFGAQTVHDGLDLDVRRGEVLGVVGGSGSGKSVLLRSIVGLRRPQGGNIEVLGRDVLHADEAELRAIEQRWGVLFQDGALFSSLTVMQNIEVPLREHCPMPEPLMDEIAACKIALVGLPEPTAEKFPSELSGGMRKRVGIARAIALRPRYILYDEPTTGLDPVTSAVIDQLMVRTREHLGVTGLVVTHDMRSAYTVGDRIAMLYEGKVRQVGTVEQIRQTEDPVVRQFIEGRPG
jgi:phospholipid/cholesterol/gamma-HCH transport system ATP-binding protein